jgi:periplasmic protein CpxP/Spy
MFSALAAAILLGTLVLGVPMPANSADLAPAPNTAAGHEVLAQAPASSAAATTQAPDTDEVSPGVEAHIRELHSKLHITPAQQTQWDNLVQVMRDNAKAMIDLQKQRAQDVKSMNAVDAVKSYGDVIRAHEEGVNKFIPAFEALYNSMSDSQKKVADSMFRSRVRSSANKAAG